MERVDNSTKKTSMEPPSLPSCLTLFAHQVAGHMFQEGKQGILSSNSPGDPTILKPFQHPPKGEVEVKFYQKLYQGDNEDGTDLQLRSFLPKFFGVVTLPLGVDKENRHLRLEDVTRPFQLPSVIDVKMGLRVWDNDAPKSKIKRERWKFPFQEVIGFRVGGIKIYDHATSSYRFYDRFYGRTLLSEELIYNALNMYIEGAPCQVKKEIVLQILSKLGQIYKWFESQRKYRFIASSLLIVYEASQQKPSCCDKYCHHDNRNDYQQCNHDNREDEQCHNDLVCSEETPEVKETTSDNKHDCSMNNSICSGQRCTEHSQRWKGELVDVRMIDFTHAYESSEYDENFVVGLQKLILFFEKIKSILSED